LAKNKVALRLGFYPRDIRMTAKKKLAIALVALLIFSVGVAGGIGLQIFHIPGSILQRSIYLFQTHITADRNEASGKPWPRWIDLNTRKFSPSLKEETYDTERDSSYKFNQRLLDLDKTALIIMDAWAYHPNDGWLKRAQENMKTKLRPLLDLARYHNMIIIHTPNEGEIAEIARPVQGEYIVDSMNQINDITELDDYLKAHNITTLLYAGYASNHCLLSRPTGIIRMHQLGYDIILVRDCTIAFEMPETLDSETANLVAINLVENLWGETTTLEDLQAAFK
jgi:nicotinamidase-related amidase